MKLQLFSAMQCASDIQRERRRGGWQGELEACTPPRPEPAASHRQGPPSIAKSLPQLRGCGGAWDIPQQVLAPSRSPGPSVGQLARGVLCRRISRGARTAVLIRHTGVAFETDRAGRFPGKGWGKGHPQLLPESSSLSTGTNSHSNPPPQQAQCWGPGGPLPPRLTPWLGPLPALTALLQNWMLSLGRGRRAMGAAGTGGRASCRFSISY